MNLEQDVNAIYKYMRVLSARQVNPLVIPQDSEKSFDKSER